MGNEQGRQLNDDELKGRQIQQMDWEMKRKLARGVDFNMRVVIRGDRSTGKSCLFNRLQGKPFIEEYNQTPAIQISSIHWNYKVTDDIIKVEVWDVVDVAKKKKPDNKDGLKTNNDEEAPPKAPELEIKPPSGKVGEGSHTFGELDARTIDVYKGTHAVIFLFDPSKKWTWEYIEKEAPNVPENIPICLLANFKDSLETVVVTEKVVRGWLQSRKHTVVYLEASMKNCYGLIGVKTFLNLPFLKMQRDGLLAKLTRNQEEITQVQSELEVISKEQSYDDYLKMMEQIKLNKSTSSTSLASGQNTPLAKSTENTPRGIVSAENTPRGPETQAANTARALSSGKLSNSQPGSSTAGAQLKKAESVPEKKITNNNSNESSGPGGFFSKIFNKVKGDDNKKAPEQPKTAIAKKTSKQPLNVTEYAPGDAAGLDAWLGDDVDVPTTPSGKSLAAMPIDDDDDDDDDDEVGDVPSRPTIAADDDGPDEDTQTKLSSVPMKSGTVAAVQGRSQAQPAKPKATTPVAPVNTNVPAPAKKSTPVQPTEVKSNPKTATAAPVKTTTAAPVKVSSAPIKTPTSSNPSSKPASGTVSPSSPKGPSSPVTAPKNSNNATAAKTTAAPTASQPKATPAVAPPKPAPKKTPVLDDSDDDMPTFNPLVARDEDSDEDDFYAETTSGAKPAPSQRVTIKDAVEEDETGSKSGSPLGDLMIDDYLQPREEDIEWVKKFEQAKPVDYDDDGLGSGGQYSDDDDYVSPRPRTEDELEQSFYSIDSSPQVRGGNNNAGNRQQSPPGRTMPSGYEAL